MQRKPTKTTRGPNAEEKRFQAWLKEQPCCVTGKPGPSIVHHCEGATFKHNKVLIGHWFCIPLSQEVDDLITKGSRRAFREEYGPQSEWWFQVSNEYARSLGYASQIIPFEVCHAIMDWGR